MAIAERIRFIRNLRGITQKYLGMMIGFSERTADIRIAQYEAGTRVPKDELINQLSMALEVCPEALKVPDIDTQVGLMHTFFALEDIYGLKIDQLDGEYCLHFDRKRKDFSFGLWDEWIHWYEQAEKYRNGEITKDEYDEWRYTYPKSEYLQHRANMDALREKNRAN